MYTKQKSQSTLIIVLAKNQKERSSERKYSRAHRFSSALKPHRSLVCKNGSLPTDFMRRSNRNYQQLNTCKTSSFYSDEVLLRVAQDNRHLRMCQRWLKHY